MSKMNGIATVTQTVSCTPDQQNLVVTNTPSFVPTYSADLERGPYRINIRDIEGGFRLFADSDANFQFYDDGRLKTINQSTTGQGEAAIKSIVSFGTTIPGLGIKPAFTGPKTLPECDVIKDKSASLSYRAEVNFPSQPPPAAGIAFLVNDPALFMRLNQSKKLPELRLRFGHPFDVGSRATRNSVPGDAPSVNLTLQKVATVEVRITANQNSIWTANVAIPTADTYQLPIPTAALFGGQKFSLTLSEAGAITAIDYNKSSGAAGAANAATAILTPETAASRANDLKTQADLIAQQQRLHACQVNPANCK